VISGYRREVAENCALLGCYAASSGNFLRGGLWTDVVAELWEKGYGVGTLLWSLKGVVWRRSHLLTMRLFGVNVPSFVKQFISRYNNLNSPWHFVCVPDFVSTTLQRWQPYKVPNETEKVYLRHWYLLSAKESLRFFNCQTSGSGILFVECHHVRASLNPRREMHGFGSKQILH
jgi:hypothetical protein